MIYPKFTRADGCATGQRTLPHNSADSSSSPTVHRSHAARPTQHHRLLCSSHRRDALPRTPGGYETRHTHHDAARSRRLDNLTLYVLHIWFINPTYDTYTPSTGYLLQLLAATAIGMFVKYTTGRGPLEAFVTTAAYRTKRTVTEGTSAPATAHHA